MCANVDLKIATASIRVSFYADGQRSYGQITHIENEYQISHSPLIGGLKDPEGYRKPLVGWIYRMSMPLENVNVNGQRGTFEDKSVTYSNSQCSMFMEKDRIARKFVLRSKNLVCSDADSAELKFSGGFMVEFTSTFNKVPIVVVLKGNELSVANVENNGTLRVMIRFIRDSGAKSGYSSSACRGR